MGFVALVALGHALERGAPALDALLGRLALADLRGFFVKATASELLENTLLLDPFAESSEQALKRFPLFPNNVGHS
jgi:hypothetical protein